MTAYTAEVLLLINERADALNKLIDAHKGTKHEYALVASLYEILSLGEKVKNIATREKVDIQKRIDSSWVSSPDRMGGQFTQDEIDRSRDGSW